MLRSSALRAISACLSTLVCYRAVQLKVDERQPRFEELRAVTRERDTFAAALKKADTDAKQDVKSVAARERDAFAAALMKADADAKYDLANKVSLSEEGYKKVAALKNDEAMLQFARRQLDALGLRAQSRGELRGWVRWFSGTTAKQSHAAMVKELLTKDWLIPNNKTGTYASNDNRDDQKKSLSVYVFARLDGIDRRAEIRSMWQRAASSYYMDVSYKFAVCGGTNGSLMSVRGDDGVGLAEASDQLKADLKAENEQFKDVAYLPCDEGYGEGALTRKVLASLKHFWEASPSHYFMKIDDDSFLSWSRYLPTLLKVGSPNIYMGIPIGEGVPCRTPGFRWYEPYSTFNGTLFPKGMSGGSGYTIGKHLVDLILHSGIGQSHILWNEDRAVGVWMDTMNSQGTKVDYQGIPGVDGFWAWDWEHPKGNWATWGKYPYTVHHGLEGKTIGCLAQADRERSSSKPIADCFEAEVGKSYEPLTCASLNTEAKKVQEQQKN